MGGHHHMAFAAVMMLIEWQFVDANCYTLLEQYFSRLVFLIKDLPESSALLDCMPLSPMIKLIRHTLLFFERKEIVQFGQTDDLLFPTTL